MKTGPFTLLVAYLLRLDSQSVAVAARHLKHKKLMSTGARGVNAPEMKGRDLAVLLLSLLATDRPAWAAEKVEQFKRFQLSAPEMAESIQSNLPDPDHTVLDFLTAICSPKVKLDPNRPFIVRAVGESSVEVQGEGLHLVYWRRSEIDRLADAFADADPDNLPPELADAMENSPLNHRGMITSREVKSNDIELIKSIAFKGVDR